jgi:hypothetical protein
MKVRTLLTSLLTLTKICKLPPLEGCSTAAERWERDWGANCRPKGWGRISRNGHEHKAQMCYVDGSNRRECALLPQ